MDFEEVKAMGKTSQIYKLHGFIPNPCKICYFMGLHHLNTKDMCTTFMCKQHE
jgi:hypothetical protein